jgi:putative endonuclease
VVAADGDTLCFVEVKARADDEHGPAIGFVGPRKQRRLTRCVALYLAAQDIHDRAVRFDVVGLEREAGAWRCELVRGAFEATSSFSV